MAGNGYPSFLRNGLPGSTGIFTCGYYRRVPGLKCTVHPGNTRRNLSNALPGSNTHGYYISGYLRVTGTCWRGPGETKTTVILYCCPMHLAGFSVVPGQEAYSISNVWPGGNGKVEKGANSRDVRNVSHLFHFIRCKGTLFFR